MQRRQRLKYNIPHWYELLAITLSINFLMMALWKPMEHYASHMASLHQSLEKLRKTQKKQLEEHWRKTIVLPMSKDDLGYTKYQPQRYWHQFFWKVLGEIQQHKNYLTNYPLDNQKVVARYMLREQNGYKLKTLLDGLVDSLGVYFKDYYLPKFHKFAEGNAHHPFYHNDAWARAKDFPHANFENATVAQALALLTQKQMVVLRYAGYVLKHLQLDDYPTYHPGWLKGIRVMDQSTQVQVGDTLKADMLLNIQNRLIPRGQGYYVEVNDQIIYPKELEVPVRFRVLGQGKQQWTGKYHFCYFDKDTTVVFKTPYWVK